MQTIKHAFYNSILAVGYVAFIATMLTNVGKIVGQGDKSPLGGVAFLLTFVISAAIMGAIVLGRPILWYLDGAKKEAITLFFYTLGFLVAELMVVFAALFVIR
jgi:hypothetical protein